MVQFSRIKNHELLSQRVYRIIKRDIISGKLASDSRLFEEKIAEQMQISRTPVREALRLLSAEGFLTLKPNNGIVVSQISPQDLVDVLHIRLQLETYAINLAAKKITDTEIKELRSILEQMREVVDSRNSLSYNNLNLKYHSRIIGISGNKKLCEICDHLHQQSEHWIRSLVLPKRMMQSLNEHISIFKALEKKDSKKSKEEMYRHVNNVISNICINKLKGEEDKG